MDIIDRGDLEVERQSGRETQKAVGKGGLVDSQKVLAGFERYSQQDGQTEVQQVGEELIYVVASTNSWVQYGPNRDQLEARISVQPGWLLHAHAGEWVRFGYDPDGSLDLFVVRLV